MNGPDGERTTGVRASKIAHTRHLTHPHEILGVGVTLKFWEKMPQGVGHLPPRSVNTVSAILVQENWVPMR